MAGTDLSLPPVLFDRTVELSLSWKMPQDDVDAVCQDFLQQSTYIAAYGIERTRELCHQGVASFKSEATVWDQVPGGTDKPDGQSSAFALALPLSNGKQIDIFGTADPATGQWGALSAFGVVDGTGVKSDFFTNGHLQVLLAESTATHVRPLPGATPGHNAFEIDMGPELGKAQVTIDFVTTCAVLPHLAVRVTGSGVPENSVAFTSESCEQQPDQAPTAKPASVEAGSVWTAGTPPTSLSSHTSVNFVADQQPSLGERLGHALQACKQMLVTAWHSLPW
jgi:hypothetical protein